MSFDAKGQRYLVVGAGATGAAVARFLVGAGGTVVVVDRDTAALDTANLPRGVDRAHERDVEPSSFAGIIPSPGVARTHPILQRARQASVPVLAEIELAFRAVRCPVIAITGTNGKSTTTVLLGNMFREAGIATFVGGNLGTPMIEAVAANPEPAVAVVEVSSFQLEWVSTFRPHVAVFLNLTPDHLDRYSDMEEYGRAKANLFPMQQAEDFAVLNRDDAWVWEMRHRTRAKVLSFGREEVEFGSYADGDEIVVRGARSRPHRFDVSVSPLQGAHNRENLLAATTVATVWGLPDEAIAAAIRATRGLPHRLEPVRTVDGVAYFDDSKGTNVGAVAKSLASFPEGVILLAGGYDKGSDFSEIEDLVRQRVRHVITFGVAGPGIATQLRSVVPTSIVAGLEAGVKLAAELAHPGDTVLLSPGCASFDEFANYADRGRRFRQWVEAL